MYLCHPWSDLVRLTGHWICPGWTQKHMPQRCRSQRHQRIDLEVEDLKLEQASCLLGSCPNLPPGKAPGTCHSLPGVLWVAMVTADRLGCTLLRSRDEPQLCHLSQHVCWVPAESQVCFKFLQFKAGRPQDEDGKVPCYILVFPSTRALGEARHRHTGLDLETIQYCCLLPVAPG